METFILKLTVWRGNEREFLPFAPKRLIVAGWVGKNRAAVDAHIEELKSHGVTPPTRTPTYMNLAADILSTDDSMGVVGSDSSGEVEAVLFYDGEHRWLGVGSDHTDRAFEAHDIPASKQMCAKIVAPVVWEFDAVADHLDRIILRSHMIKDGKRISYQEGALGDNISVADLEKGIPKNDPLPRDGYCLFCGTFPAKTGIICGERFEFEMEDPVLGFTINHAYDVRVLPQYL
jgi:hypothetical protein